MPEISYEALAGAALLVVLAVGYQYIPKGALEQVTGPSSANSGKNKKKNKKKGKSSGTAAAPGSFGGGKDDGTSADDTDTPALATKAGSTGSAKGTGKKSKSSASNASTPTASETFAAVAREPEGSAEGELAPHQGQEQGKKPKTLAERLAPKPRKTKVDE